MHNIRYVGFETLSGGGRRLYYDITSQNKAPKRAGVEIPGSAFSGPNRVTFQESAPICYEKVKREVEGRTDLESPLTFVLTPAEILDLRPRRRAAVRKA